MEPQPLAVLEVVRGLRPEVEGLPEAINCRSAWRVAGARRIGADIGILLFRGGMGRDKQHKN